MFFKIVSQIYKHLSQYFYLKMYSKIVPKFMFLEINRVSGVDTMDIQGNLHFLNPTFKSSGYPNTEISIENSKSIFLSLGLFYFNIVL